MGRSSFSVQSYYPEQTRQLLEYIESSGKDSPFQLVGFGEDMKWLCRILGEHVSGIYDWRESFQGYDIGNLFVQSLSSCESGEGNLIICPPELELVEEALRQVIFSPTLCTMPVIWNTPYAYDPCLQESWARNICERAAARAPSVNSSDRLFNLMQAVRETTQLSGDIVECGSFEGGTASLIWETLQYLNDSRKLFLFDSFQGLPTPRLGVDAHWGGTFSNISFAEIRQRFAGCAGVKLIDGNILETIYTINEPISLAHIDVDTFEAAESVTRHLWPLLEPGGILLYDDYGFFPNCLPLKIAVDDYFADKQSECLKFFLPSNGIMIRRNDNK